MSRLMIKGNQASGIYGNASQVKINEIEGMTAANVQEALVETNNSLMYTDVSNKMSFSSGYTPTYYSVKADSRRIFINLKLNFTAVDYINENVGTHTLGISKNQAIPIVGYGDGYAGGVGVISFQSNGIINIIAYKFGTSKFKQIWCNGSIEL